MTTNVFDSSAGMIATDSRWSVTYLKWLIYLDDVGFEKIEYLNDYAFMFAGLGIRVQEWKSWLRTNPTGPEGQPGHEGMAVCMVRIPAKEVIVSAGVDIIKSGAFFIGTGSLPAYACWSANKCALRAVETAKSADIYTGGEVKFFNLNDRSHNLYAVGEDVTYTDLMEQLNNRGLVMAINQNRSTPFPLKGAAASNEELRDASAKIASGELKPAAPCNGMVREWTDEEKKKFDAALGQAFGWKK